MIPLHILLVEDNKVDAQFLERRLSQAHLLQVSVDTVAWLNKALTYLPLKRYDLVLLDLGLKDSSGIDTATAVIRAAPNIPVIVLSGREDLDIARTALRAGAQSFVVKATDLTTEHLERVLLYAIERKRIEVQAKEMLLEKRSRFSEVGAPSDPHLMEPHVRCVEDGIGQLETFLAKNLPSHYEYARSVLDQSGVYTALREIRAILDIEVKRQANTRPISEAALAALRHTSKEDSGISTPAEARDALAEALLGFDDDIWGPDGDG